MAKLKTRTGVKEHKVVTQREWLKARKQLLAKEKKFSQVRDELNRHRRELPWVKVEKEYVFDGPNGKKRSLICSTAKASSLSTTLCLCRAGARVARIVLLVGPLRRGDDAHRPARHDAGGDFARAIKRNSSVQEAHGMEVQLVFLEQK